jgi:SAM-dependent methyltransferase
MVQDIKKLSEYYKYDNNENNRLASDRTDRLEEITTLRYLNSFIPGGASVLDACAAYGVYAFPLAESGYRVTAGDVVAHHVAALKEKQNDNPLLQDIYHGSICDLSNFENDSFDAVLNFGAYYHITNKKEREKSVIESMRVLKQGGLFFVAYLNKYSNFVKFCDMWQDENVDFDAYIKKGYINEDDLFYATTPEDIENELSCIGFEIIKNVATDGLKFVFRKQLNELPEDLYEKFLFHHFEMCEKRSLLGYSEHALVICKK